MKKVCKICCLKKEQGVYKRINNSKNEWCHITCGLFAKSIVRIANYATMEFELGSNGKESEVEETTQPKI